MRLAAISDTHNKHDQIRGLQGDLILHAGDATNAGRATEIIEFLEWYAEQPFKYKVYSPGNHDFGIEAHPEKWKQLCADLGIILLNHESVEIEGIKIFGSPWTPWFHDWAFNAGRTVQEAAHYRKPFIGDLWAKIPPDTNILITHGPPYDILDECPDGRVVGCKELSKVIESVKPDLHFFGHIHHSHGQLHRDGTRYYNVSMCDEQYMATNPVTYVEYEK